MRVGCLIRMTSDPYGCIRHYAEDLGFKSGQLSIWDMSLYTEESAEQIKRACRDFDFTVTAVWCGWSGPHEWSYPAMYKTIGLVPADWRAVRTLDILKGAEFANAIGVRDVVTHAGYMSDNPFDEGRLGVLHSIRYICQTIAKNGQRFLFETGEMIPNTLTQLIKDIGEENIGINFDCANMIINCRGNSADALRILAPLVRGVHAKDAVYPTGMDPKGKEVAIGSGEANFPALIAILASHGYCGDLTIEREISDIEQREKDILASKVFLEDIIKKTCEGK